MMHVRRECVALLRDEKRVVLLFVVVAAAAVVVVVVVLLNTTVEMTVNLVLLVCYDVVYFVNVLV